MFLKKGAALLGLLAILVAGCTAPDPDAAKKEALLEDAAVRHFAATHEPRRNSTGTAWEVRVIFGRKECYGLLIFSDDGGVKLQARVPTPNGGEVEQWASNPDANQLDAEKFDACFSE